jgi:hypothetical protein
MLRLTELAARELAAGHGLLVIHGVAPDLSSSRQHFYLVPAIETQFDRMVGVLVDIDGLRDAELMAYDQACRELRQQASLGRANAFNQRPDAERHEAVRQFLERQSTKGLLDWTLFGLQSGMAASSPSIQGPRCCGCVEPPSSCDVGFPAVASRLPASRWMRRHSRC